MIINLMVMIINLIPSKVLPITGLVFNFYGGVISWRLKSKLLTADRYTEIETLFLPMAIKQLSWVRHYSLLMGYYAFLLCFWRSQGGGGYNLKLNPLGRKSPGTKIDYNFILISKFLFVILYPSKGSGVMLKFEII